jgi:hypothetical protein
VPDSSGQTNGPRGELRKPPKGVEQVPAGLAD